MLQAVVLPSASGCFVLLRVRPLGQGPPHPAYLPRFSRSAPVFAVGLHAHLVFPYLAGGPYELVIARLALLSNNDSI
jgi:hypothetical protein